MNAACSIGWYLSAAVPAAVEFLSPLSHTREWVFWTPARAPTDFSDTLGYNRRRIRSEAAQQWDTFRQSSIP